MRAMILCAVVFLVGCQTTPQPVTVVRVPVPVIPKMADVPDRPTLMVKMLPKTVPSQDQYSNIVRAVEIDYANLMLYAKSLERIVNQYNTGLTEAYLEGLKREITVHQK